jgi:hypothetical protein
VVPRGPLPQELAHEGRQVTRSEGRLGRVELVERPPAGGGDVLRVELLPGQPRYGLERRCPDEVVALDLAVPVDTELEQVGAHPDERAELARIQTDLLLELAAQRLRIRLTRVDAAAGRRPARPVRELEAHEQHPLVRIDDDGADRVP